MFIVGKYLYLYFSLTTCKLSESIGSSSKGTTKTDKAQKAGEALATLMKDHNISKATFDRNGQLYHGRVKALCEGLREGGLTI